MVLNSCLRAPHSVGGLGTRRQRSSHLEIDRFSFNQPQLAGPSVEPAGPVTEPVLPAVQSERHPAGVDPKCAYNPVSVRPDSEVVSQVSVECEHARFWLFAFSVYVFGFPMEVKS